MIQQLLHRKPKHHATKKPMHPSSSPRAFQRHQDHNLKHPGSVDLIRTKQNKTNYRPSWIDVQEHDLKHPGSVDLIPTKQNKTKQTTFLHG
jgi:hypothetical protein